MACPAKYNCVTLGNYPGYMLSTSLSGQYNGNVYNVQKALTQMSRYSGCGNMDPGGCDGYYGSGTANAVRDFQSMYPGVLTADGIVGPATWNALVACHTSGSLPY